MATTNPYQNVSCFDGLRRMWYSSDLKTCSLSHQTIEIPNRVFSTRGGLHYDIYRLAISILKKDEPLFPENFSEEEKDRFYQYFHLKKVQFRRIWGEACSEFWGRAQPETFYVHKDKIEANLRMQIFAAVISRSQRSALNQYFSRPIPRFQSVYVSESDY